MAGSWPQPAPSPEPLCWGCGAPNNAGSSECWLCQRRDWNRYPNLRRRRSTSERGPLSMIGGQMVVIAGIAVALALFVAAPAVGIVLLLSAVPALTTTEFIAFRRRRRGEPMSLGQRVGWFLGLTILFPILLIALGIALFAICMAFVR
jgi:hypothetical protein